MEWILNFSNQFYCYRRTPLLSILEMGCVKTDSPRSVCSGVDGALVEAAMEVTVSARGGAGGGVST